MGDCWFMLWICCGICLLSGIPYSVCKRKGKPLFPAASEAAPAALQVVPEWTNILAGRREGGGGIDVASGLVGDLELKPWDMFRSGTGSPGSQSGSEGILHAQVVEVKSNVSKLFVTLELADGSIPVRYG